jgi:hypothetical protein
VAAGLLCSAAAAQADSIVYIDGGNVWSAKPDGTAKVQLTTGGDWHSPTQADDGTFAAVQGVSDRISFMTRGGRLIRTIQTQPAKSADGGTFAAEVTYDDAPFGVGYFVATWLRPGTTRA